MSTVLHISNNKPYSPAAMADAGDERAPKRKAPAVPPRRSQRTAKKPEQQQSMSDIEAAIAASPHIGLDIVHRDAKNPEEVVRTTAAGKHLRYRREYEMRELVNQEGNLTIYEDHRPDSLKTATDESQEVDSPAPRRSPRLSQAPPEPAEQQPPCLALPAAPEREDFLKLSRLLAAEQQPPHSTFDLSTGAFVDGPLAALTKGRKVPGFELLAVEQDLPLTDEMRQTMDMCGVSVQDMRQGFGEMMDESSLIQVAQKVYAFQYFSLLQGILHLTLHDNKGGPDWISADWQLTQWSDILQIENESFQTDVVQDILQTYTGFLPEETRSSCGKTVLHFKEFCCAYFCDKTCEPGTLGTIHLTGYKCEDSVKTTDKAWYPWCQIKVERMNMVLTPEFYSRHCKNDMDGLAAMASLIKDIAVESKSHWDGLKHSFIAFAIDIYPEPMMTMRSELQELGEEIYDYTLEQLSTHPAVTLPPNTYMKFGDIPWAITSDSGWFMQWFVLTSLDDFNQDYVTLDLRKTSPKVWTAKPTTAISGETRTDGDLVTMEEIVIDKPTLYLSGETNTVKFLLDGKYRVGDDHGHLAVNLSCMVLHLACRYQVVLYQSSSGMNDDTCVKEFRTRIFYEDDPDKAALMHLAYVSCTNLVIKAAEKKAETSEKKAKAEKKKAAGFKKGMQELNTTLAIEAGLLLSSKKKVSKQEVEIRDLQVEVKNEKAKTPQNIQKMVKKHKAEIKEEKRITQVSVAKTEEELSKLQGDHAALQKEHKNALSKLGETTKSFRDTAEYKEVMAVRTECDSLRNQVSKLETDNLKLSHVSPARGMAAAAAAEPADESSDGDERVQLGMTRVTSSDRKRVKKDGSEKFIPGKKGKGGNKKLKTKHRKQEKEDAKARAKRPHDDVDPDEGHDDWETLFNAADAELKELKGKFQKSVERKKTAVNDATKYLAENKKKQKKIDEMQKTIDDMQEGVVHGTVISVTVPEEASAEEDPPVTRLSALAGAYVPPHMRE